MKRFNNTVIISGNGKWMILLTYWIINKLWILTWLHLSIFLIICSTIHKYFITLETSTFCIFFCLTSDHYEFKYTQVSTSSFKPLQIEAHVMLSVVLLNELRSTGSRQLKQRSNKALPSKQMVIFAKRCPKNRGACMSSPPARGYQRSCFRPIARCVMSIDPDVL